ncbi:carbon starvation CstA family protein [Tautonia plasticadhaerens]|uniref:Carbon starvation protein A n=1 Tax=Tautonia plasticadhaerens TaxID=2527974 RepID=A0A518H108_9BACT|nr:carbon starvation protein A [Tautonia plasticadhaerens]QDV34493.1 Carbon starvation protein A [Tautonia plasticadhaerens]
MQTLLIALGAGVAFLVAYFTYGRWLGKTIFRLSADYVCPSHRLRDDEDYVPTPRSIVFGHHFTSIAGTGPIVGPAIAVMWGWVPALLWVVFGSIFIGAVHDFGALVVSLRNNGQTVGDIAGRLINRRARILFLLILFMALTIVLAIFGLVIAAVFRQYPASIFPCLVQIPIAVAIGLWLHRKGASIAVPSIIALALMYLTVVFGDENTPVAQLSILPGWVASGIEVVEATLHHWNAAMAAWPIIAWVAILLLYSYVASVIPVWILLQPRDYINSLQLISALGLIVVGLAVAAVAGGAPVDGELGRPELTIAAPAVDLSPADAPLIFPFLFVTIACGAISGFHCLVSSGTSSKQLDREPDARFVGYGGMLTEGFLATLVILACVAGLGLGITGEDGSRLLGPAAFAERYGSWNTSGGLASTVGAFVDGSANFLRAMGLPDGVSVALMGVLVASFAGTTLDTACRLQRYVVQELATALMGARRTASATGSESESESPDAPLFRRQPVPLSANPLSWLANKHGATIFAVVIAGALAAFPKAGEGWTWANAGQGGLILWPLFGATNQLLGGLSFLVIAFYLRRRGIPNWFLIAPLVFMLILPAWAMLWQIFIDAPGAGGSWLADRQWVLLGIGLATIVLEAWLVVEAALLWPRVRGVLEQLVAPEPASLSRRIEPEPAAVGP